MEQDHEKTYTMLSIISAVLFFGVIAFFFKSMGWTLAMYINIFFALSSIVMGIAGFKRENEP